MKTPRTRLGMQRMLTRWPPWQASAAVPMTGMPWILQLSAHALLNQVCTGKLFILCAQKCIATIFRMASKSFVTMVTLYLQPF